MYPESREEPKVYALAMQSHGYPYYVRHAVTKRENWMFVDKLLEVECKEDLKPHTHLIRGDGGWDEC